MKTGDIIKLVVVNNVTLVSMFNEDLILTLDNDHVYNVEFEGLYSNKLIFKKYDELFAIKLSLIKSIN